MGRIYDDKRWKEARADFAASDLLCHHCNTEPWTQLHHVKPLRAGGEPFQRDNLLPLCDFCHRKETRRQKRLYL